MYLRRGRHQASELIHASLACCIEGKFVRLFAKLQEVFPFDYALATLADGDNRVPIPFRGVNVGLPAEWLRQCNANRLFRRGVATRENFRSYKVQHWAESWNRFGQPPQDLKDFLADVGINNGYMHGCGPCSSGNAGHGGSVFCYTAPAVKYKTRTASILELLTPHLHLALTRVLDPSQDEQEKATLPVRRQLLLPLALTHHICY